MEAYVGAAVQVLLAKIFGRLDGCVAANSAVQC